MAFNYQRGDLLPVGWQSLGGALGTVSIKGYTSDTLRLLFDVTHTGHLGVGTARLAGRPDFTASINFDFDSDLPFYTPPISIREGFSGIFQVYIRPATFIQQPTVIEKINLTSSVDSELKVAVDLKQNVSIGAPVWPAI